MNLKAETEKQKYFHLLAEVVEDLPGDTSMKMWTAGYQVSPKILDNVRYGRAVKLDLLVAMIRVCMPGYAIPSELNISDYSTETAAA